ncbi:MAG TPA: hypothetical protein VGC79_19320 [Polyangiaceae bacterium]
MIDLREHSGPITAFLLAELARFGQEHPDVPSPHVALYCCPWSGWVSLCLNRTGEIEQNCPDFEFVEFALYEAPVWAKQYESEERLTVVDSAGLRHEVDVEAEGDELLNGLFFAFLADLLAAPRVLASLNAANLRPTRFGVQLLDSEYGSTWEAGER